MSWPTKKLGEVAFVDWGNTSITKASYKPSGYLAVSATGPDGFMDSFEHNRPAIILSAIGAKCGKTFWVDGKWTAIKNTITIFSNKEKICLTKYLYYFLTPNKWEIVGGGQPFITKGAAEKVKIPLPPLQIQTQIVERLDKVAEAQKLNDELIQKSDELFQSLLYTLIRANGRITKKLGEVCEIARGGSPRPINNYLTNVANGINWIKIGDVAKGEKYITSTAQKIKPEGVSKTRLVKEGDLILSNSMSFGRPYILKITGAIHDGWLLLRIKNKNELTQDFLYYSLGVAQTKAQFEKAAAGGVVRNLNSDLVRKVKISVPPLEIQNQIVAKLSAVQEYKTQLLAQKSKLKELFNSALAKSFSGQ